MQCPGCASAEMSVYQMAGNYGTYVEIDVCPACNGLWFDGRESVSLTPGSTLDLFRRMNELQAHARANWVELKRCPHCESILEVTSDLVKATRFSYFRCGEHGRFISFFQWLREKQLVRAATPKEIGEIRKTAEVVKCSNCGAPISLDHSMQCQHCAAPVSVLAPDEMMRAIDRLNQNEIDRKAYRPERLVEALSAQRETDALLAGDRASNRAFDLVFSGVGFIVKLLS